MAIAKNHTIVTVTLASQQAVPVPLTLNVSAITARAVLLSSGWRTSKSRVKTQVFYIS